MTVTQDTPGCLYVQFIDAPVTRTREVVPETVIVDFASDGRVVGVEVLSDAPTAVRGSQVGRKSGHTQDNGENA